MNMSHLGPNSSPMHCWLDRLGRTAIGLFVLVGVLYVSAYTVGWPNLPDPDRAHNQQHVMRMSEGCLRIAPEVVDPQ